MRTAARCAFVTVALLLSAAPAWARVEPNGRCAGGKLRATAFPSMPTA